jgi:hypothetical protein
MDEESEAARVQQMVKDTSGVGEAITYIDLMDMGPLMDEFGVNPR